MPENYRVERWTGDIGPDPSTLRRIMEDDGYSVFEWSDGPDTIYDNHAHDDDQSHWIVSGKLELTVIDAGSYVLGPGDRDFMPAGMMHSARVVSDEPVIYLIGSKR
jgi:quercetin dioxygenase-like cupin family protein